MVPKDRRLRPSQQGLVSSATALPAIEGEAARVGVRPDSGASSSST
jgi:hypothetical protein